MPKTLTETPKINLHFRRFEFKYVMPKAIAERIVPELLTYMYLDEFAGEKEHYEVHSLYFDSPEFKSYHEKIYGVMNRKKIRFRFYEQDIHKNAEVFFEIKRKSDEVILKDRSIETKMRLGEFLNNPFSLTKTGGNEKFYNEFLYEYFQYRMEPKVFVSYTRKPFFSKFSRDFRVTFDSQIIASKVETYCNTSLQAKEYVPIHPEDIVMEVKFRTKIPRWFHRIIDEYKLKKSPFSKYCEAVKTCYGFIE